MSGFARLWAAIAGVLAIFLGVVVTQLFTGFQPVEAAAPAQQATVDVTLTEFAVEPAELVAPARVPITLTVAEGGEATQVANAEGHGGHDGAHCDMDPAEMAALHNKSVEEFPAATEGKGNQPLAPVVEADGTKLFELTASEIEWEVAPGEVVEAMAYNGTVPGPRLDVDLGDKVRIVLHDELSEPTGLHLHGLPQRVVARDGYPLDSPYTADTILVAPGERIDVLIEATDLGAWAWHCHVLNHAEGADGMFGMVTAVVVEP